MTYLLYHFFQLLRIYYSGIMMFLGFPQVLCSSGLSTKISQLIQISGLFFQFISDSWSVMNMYVSSQIRIIKLELPLVVTQCMILEYSRLSFLHLKNEVGIEISQTVFNVKCIRFFDSVASQGEIQKLQSISETRRYFP